MIGGEFDVKKANPNHPVTQELDGQYVKLLLAVLVKVAPGRTVILNEQDVAKIAGRCIVVHSREKTIELSVVTMDEGEKIARREGGLPT